MQWFNPQHVEKAEEVAQKSLQLSAPIQDNGEADVSPATVANKPPSQTQFREVQVDRPHLLTLNQAMSQPRPLSQRNSNTMPTPLELQNTTSTYTRPEAEPVMKAASAETRAAYRLRWQSGSVGTNVEGRDNRQKNEASISEIKSETNCV